MMSEGWLFFVSFVEFEMKYAHARGIIRASTLFVSFPGTSFVGPVYSKLGKETTVKAPKTACAVLLCSTIYSLLPINFLLELLE